MYCIFHYNIQIIRMLIVEQLQGFVVKGIRKLIIVNIVIAVMNVETVINEKLVKNHKIDI